MPHSTRFTTIFWYVLFHRFQSLRKKNYEEYLIKGLGWRRLTVERFYRLNYTMQTSWIRLWWWWWCVFLFFCYYIHYSIRREAHERQYCISRYNFVRFRYIFSLEPVVCWLIADRWSFPCISPIEALCCDVHQNSFQVTDDWQLNRISPMNHLISCFD